MEYATQSGAEAYSFIEKETIYINDHAAFIQSSLYAAIVRLEQSCYVYQIQSVHHNENNSLCVMVTVSAATRVKGTVLCVCILC